MQFSISCKRPEDDTRFGQTVSASGAGTLWNSMPYRAALEVTLVGAESEYLVVDSDGEPVACVPTFRSEGAFGTVVNSLPFFGSHGGTVIAADLDTPTRSRVLRLLLDYWRDSNVSRVVLVEALGQPELLSTMPRARTIATRTARLTDISGQTSEDVRARIVGGMHVKQRNAFRKGVAAIASGTVEYGSELSLLRQVWELHEGSSIAQDRKPKPWRFFDTLVTHLSPSQLHVFAFLDSIGDVVAGLVLFQVGDRVEYFTPVVRHDWRQTQVLSSLIVEAMARIGSSATPLLWNWGGTWPEQTSLARFKSRWPGTDVQYRYWGLDTGDCSTLDSVEPGLLEREYPYFFVRDFRSA